MRVVDAAAVERLLPFPGLIDRLERAFRDGAVAPPRQHHAVAVPGGADGTMLVMPAWRPGGRIGVKLVSVFPGNAAAGLPSVTGIYVLMSATTGVPEAAIDGPMLTARRTAAASALAARFLARAESGRLLMIGTGALAPHLIAAHAAVRPIREVAVWGRTPAKAERLARSLADRPYRVEPVHDLEAAARAADVISCATLSPDPLVRGAWLRPGQHLDLVGAYTPAMREADDEAVRRARLYVDTRAGALKEAGDLIQPLRAGVIAEGAIVAELAELARGERPGRRSADEITLFKSVGTALEDLAAAEMIAEGIEAAAGRPGPARP